MTALHWFLLLPIGWGVLIVCKPQVHWRLQAWRYRDPEANYPSETWFFMHRLSGIVLVVVALVLGGQMWESAPTSSSERPASSSASQPRIYHHTLTTQEKVVRISGYTVDAEDELTVYISLGSCAFPQLHVRAVEDKETIVLTGKAFTSESCEEGSAGSLHEEVRLNEPVGDREVVDSEGTAVRLCEESC